MPEIAAGVALDAVDTTADDAPYTTANFTAFPSPLTPEPPHCGGPALAGLADPYPPADGPEAHRVAVIRALAHHGGVPVSRLFPARLHREIAELDAVIDEYVAGTIRRVAAAATQEEYTAERRRLTAVFHEFDGRLARGRFLLGPQITEPDIRLWTLLVRYDRGYNPFAKISKLRLIDFPRLWAYARDLYQRRPFRDTTDFAAIARLPEAPPPPYFHDAPWRILVEPYVADWEAPHGRERP